MELITLRPLTPANWKQCIDLSVREDQKNFVAPNVFSYGPHNLAAEQLYSSFGFQPTGKFIEGEKVSCLELSARAKPEN